MDESAFLLESGLLEYEAYDPNRQTAEDMLQGLKNHILTCLNRSDGMIVLGVEQ
jgi:hypothetical protein